MFLLHDRNIFPCGKTGKHWGNMCLQQMFLTTYFLVLPGLKDLSLFCAAHPYCARYIASFARAGSARASKAYQIPYEAKLTREKNAYLLLNKQGDLPFLSNLDLAFILYLLKELDKNHVFESRLIARNVLFTKVKQEPLKSERGEVFDPISSDATCICHKIYFKLFLDIDIVWLLRYLNICFSFVLSIPTQSSIRWYTWHMTLLSEKTRV